MVSVNGLFSRFILLSGGVAAAAQLLSNPDFEANVYLMVLL